MTNLNIPRAKPDRRPRKEGWSARLMEHLPEWVPMCLWKLRRDHADQMAAALTYRTIFSMVPILALALLVFRSVGGFDKLSVSLETRTYEFLGLSTLYAPDTQPADSNATASTQENDPEHTPRPASGKARAEDLRKRLRKGLEDINATIQGLSVKRIGAVGMVLFIWAALALVVGIESSFNTIYNAPRGRPFHMRVAIYWAAITLGPILLGVSIYLASKVTSIAEGMAGASVKTVGAHALKQVASTHGELLPWLLAAVGHLLALLASWLLIFLLYRLIPNTKVLSRPAMIGSFVAALAWEIGKWGFRLYVHKAVGYSIVYGSLALVPLFLLWIYITWLIVLFGLELAYVLQMLRNKRFKYLVDYSDRDLFYDPRWLLPMMGLIGREFTQGHEVSVERLARELALPVRVVLYLGSRLQAAGLIHRTQPKGEDEAAFALARSPEQIQVADLMDLSRTIADEASVEGLPKMARTSLPGGKLIQQLDEAQLTASANHTTLAEMLKQG